MKRRCGFATVLLCFALLGPSACEDAPGGPSDAVVRSGEDAAPGAGPPDAAQSVQDGAATPGPDAAGASPDAAGGPSPSPAPAPTSTRFTLAVIPDTQYLFDQDSGKPEVVKASLQ